jgi:hypothetical protein
MSVRLLDGIRGCLVRFPVGFGLLFDLWLRRRESLARGYLESSSDDIKFGTAETPVFDTGVAAMPSGYFRFMYKPQAASYDSVLELFPSFPILLFSVISSSAILAN